MQACLPPASVAYQSAAEWAYFLDDNDDVAPKPCLVSEAEKATCG